MTMKMTMAEFVGLEPCPFCGSEFTQVRYMGGKWSEPNAFDDGYRGECCDCGAITAAYDTEAEAITAWNKRVAYEMEGWFYLPKPKEQLFSYTTGFTFDDLSLKATASVDVYALADAVRKWQEEELNKHIVERICEVFKPERTCRNTDDEFPFFECSECGCNAVVGYGSSGDGLPNYCPNCGARVIA